MKIYLIRNTEAADPDELWWCNEDGWSNLTDTATVYSEEERQWMQEPIGGEWVAFSMVGVEL